MNILPLTEGKIAGTGTVKLTGHHTEGGVIGGVLISTDNSNAAAVILRKDNSSGAKLFDISTKTALFITAPIMVADTDTIYYDISGTGASAMLYEWND
jgi:hypothetical protein